MAKLPMIKLPMIKLKTNAVIIGVACTAGDDVTYYEGRMHLSDWVDGHRAATLTARYADHPQPVRSDVEDHVVWWTHTPGYTPDLDDLTERGNNASFWDDLDHDINDATTAEEYDAIGERVRKFLETGEHTVVEQY